MNTLFVQWRPVQERDEDESSRFIYIQYGNLGLRDPIYPLKVINQPPCLLLVLRLCLILVALLPIPICFLYVLPTPSALRTPATDPRLGPRTRWRWSHLHHHLAATAHFGYLSKEGVGAPWEGDAREGRGEGERPVGLRVGGGGGDVSCRPRGRHGPKLRAGCWTTRARAGVQRGRV